MHSKRAMTEAVTCRAGWVGEWIAACIAFSLFLVYFFSEGAGRGIRRDNVFWIVTSISWLLVALLTLVYFAKASPQERSVASQIRR